MPQTPILNTTVFCFNLLFNEVWCTYQQRRSSVPISEKHNNQLLPIFGANVKTSAGRGRQVLCFFM